MSRKGVSRKAPLARVELNEAPDRTKWLKGSVDLMRAELSRVTEGTYDFVDENGRSLQGSFKAQ
jgi:hypothetical protein